MHCAVFQHVDLHAGLLDDGLDLLTARPDQVADLVVRDAQLVQARSIRGNCASGAKRLFHYVENLQLGFLGLRQSFAHHRNADAEDLDVHLQRGDSFTRSSNFEVHVAVMIFRARDVREDGIFLVVFNDQAHGNARARSLQRHARIHQRQ